jgi:hypothetical protein
LPFSRHTMLFVTVKCYFKNGGKGAIQYKVQLSVIIIIRYSTAIHVTLLFLLPDIGREENAICMLYLMVR